MATLFALVEKDDQNNTQSMTYCFQRDLVTQILGQPVMLARYEFAGKFMAYCLYRGMYVSAQLTPFVYKYLLNPDVAVTYEDYLKVCVLNEIYCSLVLVRSRPPQHRTNRLSSERKV